MVAGGHTKDRAGWLREVATARDALAIRRATIQLEEAVYGERVGAEGGREAGRERSQYNLDIISRSCAKHTRVPLSQPSVPSLPPFPPSQQLAHAI